MFRGAERDLKMLKTGFIMKSPCLFLEKFTLKKKNGWGKRAWFHLGLELLRGEERDIKMLKTAFIMKSPCLFFLKNLIKKGQMG